MKRNIFYLLLIFLIISSLFCTASCDNLLDGIIIGSSIGGNNPTPDSDPEVGTVSSPEPPTESGSTPESETAPDSSGETIESETDPAITEGNIENPPVPRDLSILYSSNNPNVFFSSFLDAFSDERSKSSKATWETFTYDPESNTEIPNSGYDIYIYENYLPTDMPSEGVCIVINPSDASNGLEFSLGMRYQIGNHGGALTPERDHPVINDFISDGICVTQFREISSHTPYTPILYFSEYTVAVASKSNAEPLSVVLFSFSLNYSEFAMLADFPIMMYNIIEYYTSGDTAVTSNKSDHSNNTPTDSLSENTFDPSANQILDGCTYYKEVLGEYIEICNYRLSTEGHGLTNEQISIINKYFEYLSIYQ